MHRSCFIKLRISTKNSCQVTLSPINTMQMCALVCLHILLSVEVVLLYWRLMSIRRRALWSVKWSMIYATGAWQVHCRAYIELDHSLQGNVIFPRLLAIISGNLTNHISSVQKHTGFLVDNLQSEFLTTNDHFKLWIGVSINVDNRFASCSNRIIVMSKMIQFISVNSIKSAYPQEWKYWKI